MNNAKTGKTTVHNQRFVLSLCLILAGWAGFPVWTSFAEVRTFTSVGPIIAIPDDDPGGVSSTISVPAGVDGFQDMDVSLTLNHSWMGDLVATVTSPMGTQVDLFNRPGTSFVGSSGFSIGLDGTYVFDDDTADELLLGVGDPMTPGVYRASTVGDVLEFLSEFNGEDPFGTWTLDISDHGPGDEGGLSEWSLVFTVEGEVLAVRETAPRTYDVVNYAAINSAAYRALPMALVQRRVVLGTARSAARDPNSRLMRIRAEAASGVPPRVADRPSEPVQYVMAETDYGRPAFSPPSLRSPYKTFLSGGYSQQDINTMGDVIGSKSETWSGSGGLELQASETLTLGLGLTGLSNETEVSEDVGTMDVSGVNVSPYMTLRRDALYADFLYSLGVYENDIARKTGLGLTAKASPDSMTHNLVFNVGHGIRVGPFVTGPLGAVDYLSGEVDGYTERGGGSAGVRVDDQNFDSLMTRLGWQVSCPLDASIAPAALQIHASWNHEFLDDSDGVRVSLIESPYMRVRGRSRTSYGGFTAASQTEELSRDYLVLGAGILMELGGNARMFLDYEGQLFRGEASSHSGSFSLFCPL